MDFIYKGQAYVLFELVDPFEGTTSDVLQIMKIKGDLKSGNFEYEFVNYFYGACSLTEEEAIEIAKQYIDEE